MKWILVSCFVVALATAADVEVLARYDKDPGTPSFEGWVLLGSVDSNADKKCPSPWKILQLDGKRYCKDPSYLSGCSSLIYTPTMSYNKTLGMVRGYQKGTPDGFRACRDDGYGINDPYIDGVSITLGSPRKHVWTYATGLTSDGNYPNNNCPCAVTPGPNPPSFVGENYYCSSGSSSFPAQKVYTDDPLWQGTGCTNSRDNCCASVGLPWFYPEFPTLQNEPIEVRICSNQPYSDEAILLDKLELYIK